MSRNACENRRNGNDFHSGHRKQKLNLQTLQTYVFICSVFVLQIQIHLSVKHTTLLKVVNVKPLNHLPRYPAPHRQR